MLDALSIQQLAIYFKIQAVGLVVGDEIVKHLIEELTIGKVKIGWYTGRIGVNEPTLLSGRNSDKQHWFSHAAHPPLECHPESRGS
jgi:hypothetical protein